VNLAGTGGQIEVTMNINSGNQQIGSVAVFIGSPNNGSCTTGVNYVEAERQNFGVNGAPTAPVTLSINTAKFDPITFQPEYLNGEECIQARLSPVNGPEPDASNTYKLTLVNPDVVYFNATLDDGGAGLNHTGNSAAQAAGVGAGTTWWRGGFTFQAHPVLYSGAANVTSIAYTSSDCGGAAAGAAPWTATFSCAGVTSALPPAAGQSIQNAVTINYVPGYTLTASPTTFMTAASPGFVPGSPVYATVETREDNVGPVTATPIFNNPGAGGWHGNGSNGVNLPPVIPGTTYSVSATDAGVGGGVANAGLASLPQINETTLPMNNIDAANDLPETLNPTPYRLRGTAVNDILGNVGSQSGLSAIFGVDLNVLDAQYADRVNSNLAGSIWQGTNQKIYSANATTLGVSPGTGATGQAVTDWDIGGGPDGGAENIAIDAIDTRSGLDQPAGSPLTQRIQRSNAGGTANCLAAGTYAMPTILVDQYVQSIPQQFDCGLAAGARVGEYTWWGYVSDRAGNARLAQSANSPPLAGTVTMLQMAIDEAAPNITGIGFQTSLYAGGQPATYSFSANDDLELWQGSVTLAYTGHAPINYPYGSSAYTSGAFGVPFDGVFANVVNGASLTLGYYIDQYDFATAAPFVPGVGATGNVLGFTSGGVNNGVTANVRDVAAQTAAAPLVAPVLITQLQQRVAAPAYATMIDFRIVAKSGGNAISVRTALPSSVSLPFCDRIDIYEVAENTTAPDVLAAGMLANDASIGDDAAGPGDPGDRLIYRSSIVVNAGDPFLDNGFQRLYTHVSGNHTNLGTGFYVAACVKGGSALLSPLF
jgi:hypothetical protein